MRTDRTRRSLHLGVGGVRSGIGDRVADRPGEQERLLRNDSQPTAIADQVEPRHVGTVDADHTPGGVVETRDQLDDRRFAGSGLAHQRDGLPGGHPKVHPVQRGTLGAGVLEPHTVQLDLAGKPTDRNRIGPGRGGCGCAQQVRQPAQTHLGLLVTVEHLRQLLDRGEEQVDVEQVGDEPAGGQRSGRDQPGAGAENERGRQLRAELHEREIHRDEALRPKP